MPPKVNINELIEKIYDELVLAKQEIVTLHGSINALTTICNGLTEQMASQKQALEVYHEQNTKLTTENASLLTQLSKSRWETFNRKTAVGKSSLIIGGSSVRSIDQTKLKDTKVRSIPGGKISNVREHLEATDEIYSHIFLHVGTNDIGNSSNGADIDIDALAHEYTALLETTKKHTDHITVSSILPRTDRDLTTAIDALNVRVQELCLTNEVKFIDNNNTFRLRDNQVNEGYLHDGLHLTKAGTNSLVRNVGLEYVHGMTCCYCPPYKGCEKLNKSPHHPPTGEQECSEPRNTPRQPNAHQSRGQEGNYRRPADKNRRPTDNNRRSDDNNRRQHGNNRWNDDNSNRHCDNNNNGHDNHNSWHRGYNKHNNGRQDTRPVRPTYQKSGAVCWSCGEEGHIERNCHYAAGEVNCFNCGVGGHKVKDCWRY